MSVSRCLTASQERGLLKAGDLLVPGGEGLPAFSRTPALAYASRMVDHLTPRDASDLRVLLGIFAVLPRPLVRLILRVASRPDRFPPFLATQLRKLNIGIKGVVMTLYYSDPTIEGRVHGELGWETRCGTEPGTPASRAFQLARSGEGALRALSVRDRLRLLTRLQQVVVDHQEKIIDEIQACTGKSRTDALTSDVFGVLDHLAYLRKHAAKHLRPRKMPTPPVLMGKRSAVVFEPIGTVLVISPWNYPFYQAIVPITSALVCGNPVVYKPSELTPMKGLIERLLSEAGIPAEWVQIVYGDASVGRELIEQRPARIFFTGGTRAGKQVMEQASRQLIPVELELGGKDPMLVFEDANLERAVAGAIWGGLTNAGQSCTSVERVLVQDGIYEKFRDRLVADVGRLSQGVDLDGSADLGVMTSDAQVRVVAEHLEDAVSKGAKLLTGAGWDRKHRAVPGLVLEGVTPEMKVYREETFGPVIPLMRFATEEEAVRIANDSEYGLSASVWSADLGRARRVAGAIVTGNVSINNVMITEGNHALPFGGVKNSGFGRYKGEFGLMAFSNVKSLMWEKSSSKIEANWYPYTSRKYQLFQRLIQAIFGGRRLRPIAFALAGLGLEGYVKRLAGGKKENQV